MTYTQPLLLIFLLIGLMGLVRVGRGKKRGLAVAGMSGILLLSWPPVDWLLSRPLEAQYPIRPFPPATAQAIVVLASSVQPRSYERPYGVLGNDTYQRCEFAAWLHKRWQALPVLACGGPGRASAHAASVAMREMLRGAGVPG